VVERTNELLRAAQLQGALLNLSLQLLFLARVLLQAGLQGQDKGQGKEARGGINDKQCRFSCRLTCRVKIRAKIRLQAGLQAHTGWGRLCG